jgi:predicted 2-oxoglutarate/Fe(II)-dependent dioxygenase YbiX
MEIKQAIKIYDNFIRKEYLQKLLTFCNTLNFEDATTVGDNYDHEKKIKARVAQNIGLSNQSNCMTNVFWCNYLAVKLKDKVLNSYIPEVSSFGLHLTKMQSMAILKYTEGGYYTFHHDDCFNFHRQLSVIFMLNDDFEGGSLIFADPITREETEIKALSNRLIIWPSNLLYPHAVKPVTKGTRYSIVSWLV